MIHQLPSNFEKAILGSSRLSNKDVLVCNGGGNDVYNSNSKKVILQIAKFLQDNDKSNTIMLVIPHRYDVPDNSLMNMDIKTFNSKLKKIAKLFKHVTILEFSFTRNCFTQHGLHLNGYGKGLLAKQLASLIYKMNCPKAEEPITPEWKMGLNDNATSHPSTVAPNCSITQSDKVTCRTSTRIKKPPITTQSDFLMVNDILCLENTNIRNQYGSYSTNFYSDFKLNPPNNKVNSDFKDSSNNLKVYHQNIRSLRRKLSQLSNILYSELPHIICITEHHLKDFEMDMMTIEYYKLDAKFCRHPYKNGGACIFVHESVDFDSISTHHIGKEKDLEICAVK